MKVKILFTALFLSVYLSPVNSQVNQIKLLNDPAKSRGYSVWEDLKAFKYKIEIFERLDSSNYNLLGTKLTTVNYTKIDPVLFSTPNVYYKISALDNNNNIISASAHLPCRLLDLDYDISGIGEPVPYDELCTIKCNGKSYAWELRAFTQNNGVSERLKFGGTSQYYDEITLEHTPFWQPIGQVSWDNLSTSHPYKETTYSVTNNQIVPKYERRLIADYLSDGPFF